jgi:hypothetical protein
MGYTQNPEKSNLSAGSTGNDAVYATLANHVNDLRLQNQGNSRLDTTDATFHLQSQGIIPNTVIGDGAAQEGGVHYLPPGLRDGGHDVIPSYDAIYVGSKDGKHELTIRRQDQDHEFGEIKGDFTYDGVSYVAKKNPDGSQSFVRSENGKETATDITSAFLSNDGTLLINHSNNNSKLLEIRDPNGNITTATGADASVSNDGTITINHSDGTHEMRRTNGDVVLRDSNWRVTETIAHDNRQRIYTRNDAGELQSVSDSEGLKLTRQSDGSWLDGDGKQVSNVQVNQDGTLSYKDGGGHLQVWFADGGHNDVTPQDLGSIKDYPDNSKDFQQEEARLRAAEQAGNVPVSGSSNEQLNANGKAVVDLLHGQGISSVDMWYGSNILVQGDNGTLYDQLSKLGTPPGSAREDRSSSHYSSAQQFQIKLGPGQAVVLVGKDEHNNTWIQFEHSADEPGWVNQAASGFVGMFGGPSSWRLQHDKDKNLSDKSQLSVGPVGQSARGDRDRIVVDYQSGQSQPLTYAPDLAPTVA